MIRGPSVPSDGFQPASQRALSVVRGSEPSVPHTIQPLKPHTLDVMLYHLLCWLLVASFGQNRPVRTPHAIPCSLPIPRVRIVLAMWREENGITPKTKGKGFPNMCYNMLSCSGILVRLKTAAKGGSDGSDASDHPRWNPHLPAGWAPCSSRCRLTWLVCLAPECLYFHLLQSVWQLHRTQRASR